MITCLRLFQAVKVEITRREKKRSAREMSAQQSIQLGRRSRAQYRFSRSLMLFRIFKFLRLYPIKYTYTGRVGNPHAEVPTLPNLCLFNKPYCVM